MAQISEKEREKFLQAFSKVPADLRDTIIAVLDSQPYTWESAFLEIRDKTEKGEKLLKVLQETKIL